MTINIEAFNKLAFPAFKCVDSFNFDNGFETFNSMISQKTNLAELFSVDISDCSPEQIAQLKNKLSEHYLKECFEQKVRDYLVEHNQLTSYLNWFFEKVVMVNFSHFLIECL